MEALNLWALKLPSGKLTNREHGAAHVVDLLGVVEGRSLGLQYSIMGRTVFCIPRETRIDYLRDHHPRMEISWQT